MNRRGFLQRLLALPAALLGIKALEKPKKEWVYGEFWVNKDRFVTWEKDGAEHCMYLHEDPFGPPMHCWYRFDPPVRIG